MKPTCSSVNCVLASPSSSLVPNRDIPRLPTLSIAHYYKRTHKYVFTALRFVEQCQLWGASIAVRLRTQHILLSVRMFQTRKLSFAIINKSISANSDSLPCTLR
eukprot:TRINITY_DN51806_c0_g1_i5.p1 TRINITY_DN51806_c0_g1~~TRINITY_DN51806_c0_g1_i5.p1  ORF type:complete len:104 (+),score=6.05 TRINITY_DN51806_c0_g1_i5:29-340(+)